MMQNGEKIFAYFAVHKKIFVFSLIEQKTLHRPHKHFEMTAHTIAHISQKSKIVNISAKALCRP